MANRKVPVSVPCWACKGTNTDYFGTTPCHACRGTGVEIKKQTRMLCIGGPFDGQFQHEAIVVGEYIRYNASKYAHGYGQPQRQTAIYVHHSLLDKDFE